jgi:hypothetical protein
VRGSVAEVINVGDSSGGDTVNIGVGAGSDSVNIGTSGNPVSSFNVYGPHLINTPTNSTTALQVQNASNNNVLTVDTTGGNQNNLITNPSFENNSTTGWTADSTCGLSAVTSATTPAFNGSYSGQCSNTGIGQGFKWVTGALTPSTIYTLDFDAKVSATPGNVLNFGHVENGGSEDTAGLSMTSQTVLSNGWTHYSLTFKTGATLAAGDYIYIKQNDATTRDLWLDAVTLQTDTNADNNYREGKVQLGGVITSPTILQNASNSSTAFQVQNAAGANVFTVSTDDTNLLPNPGAEVNTAGWSAKGNGTIIRDTSQQKTGLASFKLTTTTTNNDGAQYTGLSLPDGTYSIALSAKLSAGAFGAGGLQAGITNTAGDNACTLAPAVSATIPTTTGWTQFTCTVAITTTVGTAFFVRDNDAAAHTFWVDDIELDSGSVLTPYGLGSLSVNAVVNTPLTLQNQSDSTTALSLYNAEGNSVLNVDTLNSTVTIAGMAPASVSGAAGTSAANTLNVTGSTGGAVSSGVFTAGNGGALSLTSGAGGASTSGTGGNGGAIAIQGGAAGTGGVTAGSIGAITLNALGGNVSIGTTGSTAAASTSSIGTSTGATQTVNLGATGSGTAAAGTTVNIQGGTGASAVVVQSAAAGTISIGNNTVSNNIQIGTASTNTSNTQNINIGNLAAARYYQRRDWL